VSTQLTDRLLVGAQVYDRNIGHLGNGHPMLDWAVVDYRFRKWLGVRAGKVKTTLGLHNDTQDMEFLHTWAILPQSLYPLDLRSETIAHIGGDVYGTAPLSRYGDLSYTVYGGIRPTDNDSGLIYGIQRRGITLTDQAGTMLGADLRWNTPLKGLLAGASFLSQHNTADGIRVNSRSVVSQYIEDSRKIGTVDFYAQYGIGNLRLEAEYRRNYNDLNGMGISENRQNADVRGWYGSAAYRLHKRVEVGTYYSRFYPTWQDPDRGAPDSHIFDKVATIRVDLTSWSSLKVEGHWMDGYGHTSSFRGFYAQDQPNDDPFPKTNLLVVRLGFNF
jgi:hypothetical protein